MWSEGMRPTFDQANTISSLDNQKRGRVEEQIYTTTTTNRERTKRVPAVQSYLPSTADDGVSWSSTVDLNATAGQSLLAKSPNGPDEVLRVQSLLTEHCRRQSFLDEHWGFNATAGP